MMKSAWHSAAMENMLKYGAWRLVSVGPDQKYAIPGAQNLAVQGTDIPYDSTNGTVSLGNILRTQISPTGRMYVYE